MDLQILSLDTTDIVRPHPINSRFIPILLNTDTGMPSPPFCY